MCRETLTFTHFHNFFFTFQEPTNVVKPDQVLTLECDSQRRWQRVNMQGKWISGDRSLLTTHLHSAEISCFSCCSESCKYLCFIWWEPGGRGRQRVFSQQPTNTEFSKKGFVEAYLHMNKLFTNGEHLMPAIYGWTHRWRMCLEKDPINGLT